MEADAGARPARKKRVFRTRQIDFTLTPRGLLISALIATFVLSVCFTLGIRVGRQLEANDLRAIEAELPAAAVVAPPAPVVSPPVVAPPVVATATVATATVAAPEPEVEIQTNAPTSGFGLQLGAFPNRDEAKAFVAKHRDILAGAKVFLVPTEIPDRGTWYRVRIGAVKQRADAEQLRQRLPEELARGALVVSHK